ncbi:MAG: V-type ATP synthase subunit E [Spirochaetes bacterium]|nr:V-type ATP synthase subunit E [Spirochaetota bacterium]
MAVEDIVKKIITDAEQEAEKIIGSYKKQADKLLSQKKKELKKTQQESEEMIEREAENLKQRTFQIAQLEMRKKVLEEKQKIIENIFIKVKEKIYHMPKEAYLDFIKNKIISYIETGDEEIIVGKQDEDIITASFIESVNQDLKSKLREKTKLKISGEKTDMDKGFILKQGKIRINCSIETLMSEARERCKEDVVNALYKEKE